LPDEEWSISSRTDMTLQEKIKDLQEAIKIYEENGIE